MACDMKMPVMMSKVQALFDRCGRVRIHPPTRLDETRPSDFCLPVTISWTIWWGKQREGAANRFSLLKGDSNEPVIRTETTDHKTTLTNLEVGRDYRWVVETEGKDGETLSSRGRFTTSPELPRWITIDGLVNVRDCGGWMTFFGWRIRQGMLYRGPEIDGPYVISPQGRKDFLALGIRTDLDFRGEEEGHPAFEPESGVEWIRCPIRGYGHGLRNPEMHAGYRAFFEVLCRPERFPIYAHCSLGADRAGTAVFLLHALLGASEEDAGKAYLLTNLANCPILGRVGHRKYQYRSLIGYVRDELGEGGIDRGTRKYLQNIGLSNEQLDTIIDIFLEDPD